ncbi:MAG: hypothetical protein GX614_10470, partial [Sandaracinaceae bacterium]|nr:hypothetical protein [Sandaracinaceae bacterium]
HGQLMRPSTLRHTIRRAGKIPIERNTRYETLRRFDHPPEEDPNEPLDRISDPDEAFGSYEALARDERFRYEPRSVKRRRLQLA